MIKYTDDEYTDVDDAHNLLLIGTEDDGRVYISVNDREPIILTPDRAVRAATEILVRAAAPKSSQS